MPAGALPGKKKGEKKGVTHIARRRIRGQGGA